MEKSQDRLTDFLQYAFWSSLVFRLFLTFYYNPMAHIFSDMGRHWSNGMRLFNPDFEGGLDPKLFQVFLFIVQKIFEMSHLNNSVPAFAMGLLSILMAWSYYRLCREIFPKKTALIIALIISLSPSLLLIYSFFLMETITITMTGFALWMTFRAIRKKDFASFIVAVMALMLAALTRNTILPISLVCIFYLMYLQKDRVRAFIFSALIALTLLIPASVHSYKGVNNLWPMGHPIMNQIYRKSGHMSFQFNFRDKGWLGWGSGSYAANPYDPFGIYHSHRLPTPYVGGFIDPKDWTGWRQKLAEVESRYTFPMYVKDIQENIILMLVGIYWPDAMVIEPNKKPMNLLVHMNYHIRWIWLGIIPFILFYFPFARISGHPTLIGWLSFMMIVIFIFQQVGIMEARFRKPIEPIFIITLVLLLRARLYPTGALPLWKQTKNVLSPMLRH